MEHQVMIMGLPGTGKTTFLAALGHMVTAGEVETMLSLDKWEGDFSHMNKLAGIWQRFIKFDRTRPTDEHQFVIPLRTTDGRATIKVRFPDLSGESFRRQWRDRICNKQLVKQISKCDGILYFLHATMIKPHVSLVKVIGDGLLDPALTTRSPIDDSRQVDVGDNQHSDQEGSDPRPWEPRYSPPGVAAVDLLQLLLKPPFSVKRRRLGIILSAWDGVDDSDTSPTQWLSENFPFFFQFLTCNEEMFEVRIYGVSAQGFDYGNEEQRSYWQGQRYASKRVKITGSQGQHHDITQPIAWAIGVED